MDRLIRLALTLARMAHRGQLYGELPYFDGHVMPVVNRVRGDPRAGMLHVTVAVLHDIVEDTAVTMREIQARFGTSVASSVYAITRRETEPYFEYIERVSNDPVAALVKAHDLRENLANDPKPSLRARYEKALATLDERLAA